MASITRPEAQHHALITLAGDVDAAGGAHFNGVIDGLIESGCARSRVDLGGVLYIDTSGMRSLLQIRDKMDLEVISINPVVRRLFELTGWTEAVEQSSEQHVPERLERAPITDCAAIAGDLTITSFSVTAELRSGRIVRDRVAQMARTMDFSDEQVDELKLAVGEAVTNAILHGSQEVSKTINVRCVRTPEELVVEIADDGPGFAPCGTAEAPCEPSEGGMGLMFMQQMVDEVSFDFSHGTSVTLVKRIHG